MEALMGYGSDESDDESHSSVEVATDPSKNEKENGDSNGENDSVSNNESNMKRKNNEQTTDGSSTSCSTTNRSNGLTGLLSDYSDDDTTTTTTANITTHHVVGINNEKIDSNDVRSDYGKINFKPSTKSSKEDAAQGRSSSTLKRKRRWDNSGDSSKTHREVLSTESQNVCKHEMILPPPRLLDSKASPFDALVLFSKDYISDKISMINETNMKTASTSDTEKSNSQYQQPRPQLIDKLNGMFQNFYSKNNTERTKNGNNDKSSSSLPSSFASHLKSQKEFGNPHLFPSIIDHFGINPIMGSNLPSSCCDPERDFAPFEYVERIVAKEEENRIRSFERR